ncbi:MAG: 5-oxoprolinase subunit PxpA [Herpetosiphonaceae bacterium]|nr:5-oxoprolinase subunit PxpA [Herpetosiphonaceae bacterium]
MKRSIDLNADVGEGCGDDAALLPLVTSCNIACGAHAGDAAMMRRTVELALRHSVQIGAHPGYADRANFGRIVVPLEPDAIVALVSAQIADLANIAGACGAALHHVKPHGALYNLAASDPVVAQAVAQAVASVDPRLILVGLAESALTAAGAALGLPVAHEAFVDRAYHADGTLRPRILPGAVHSDQAQAISQALALATSQPFAAYAGQMLRRRADTLCIHGDTPQAISFAQALRTALENADIALAALNLQR